MYSPSQQRDQIGPNQQNSQSTDRIYKINLDFTKDNRNDHAIVKERKIRSHKPQVELSKSNLDLAFLKRNISKNSDDQDKC